MKEDGERLIWGLAGGNTGRQGRFPKAASVEGRPIQRLRAQGAVQAAVVFDGEDRAFAADMAGGVQAFSMEGNALWRVMLSGGVRAAPAAHPKEPRLFVATMHGWVYAMDTVRGRIVWKVQIPTSADPRILSDLLFVPQAGLVVLSSWGGRFWALDAASGKTRFSWDAGVFPCAAASAAGDGMIYCLRAVSGRGIEFLSVNLEGMETMLHIVPEDERGARRALVSAAPVIDDGRGVVYFIVNGAKEARLCCWALSSSETRWRSELPRTVQATPCLTRDGNIVAADLAGAVHATGADGTYRYHYETGCEYVLAAGASEAGGASFIGDTVGVLHAVDASGAGWRVFEAGRSMQAGLSFDRFGRLYAPCTDGTVYVLSGS